MMLKTILTGLAVAAAAAAGGGYYLINQAASQQVDDMLAQAVDRGLYEEAEYAGMDIALDGDVTLHDLRLVHTLELDDGSRYPLEVVLDQVEVTDYDLEHEFPHRVTLQVRGVTFPQGLPFPAGRTQTPFSAYLSSLMHEGSLPLVVDYHYDYRPEQEDRTHSRFALALDQAAAARLEATVENLPLDQVAGARDQDMGAIHTLTRLSQARVPGAAFALDDEGMVDGLLAEGARQKGITPQAYREDLLAQLAGLQLFVPQSLQAFARQTTTALAQFLEGGKTLAVSIEPEFGGDIRQLQNGFMTAFFSQEYGAMVNLLNLKVQVGEAAVGEEEEP